MADLQGIWHEEDWPSPTADEVRQYFIGIDPYELSDEDKKKLIVGTKGELETDNEQLVANFHSASTWEADILEQRFNRTFKMTESKRRLAEHPRIPSESYSFDHVKLNAQIKRIKQFIPKPEKTDRLLEYNKPQGYFTSITLRTGRGGLFIQDPTTSRENVDENGKLLYRS